MALLTRKLLCAQLGVSNATLRRLLNALLLFPLNISLDKHNVATYLYDEQVLDTIRNYILLAKRKQLLHLPGTYRCRGGCNRYLPKLQLNKSSICSDCVLAKQLLNIAYDKKPWLRVLDIPIVLKSIDFLQNLLKKAKN